MKNFKKFNKKNSTSSFGESRPYEDKNLEFWDTESWKRLKIIRFKRNYSALQSEKQLSGKNKLKRLINRNRLKKIEKKLNGLVYQKGFSNRDFAIMRSKGDEGLFGDLTTQEMKKKLNIPTDRSLADFLPPVLIKAKYLAAQKTFFEIEKANDLTKTFIINHHIKNNQIMRGYLLEKRIVPENLLAREDIREIRKKLKRQQQLGVKIKNNSLRASNIPKDARKYDLQEWILFIMYNKPDKQILTKDLRNEALLKEIIPEKYKEINPKKNEPHFYQILRNLKSNQNNRTNFIRQGYCLNIKNGFKLTPKGLNYVESTFKNYLQSPSNE